MLSQHRLFFKFILTGVINTVFGYLVFACLIKLGLHYVLAIFLGTCLGVLFNFHTFGTLVFHNKHYKLIPRFIVVYGIILVFNILLVKLFLIDGFNSYIAGAIATVPMALLSYHLNKRWVFKKNE